MTRTMYPPALNISTKCKPNLTSHNIPGIDYSYNAIISNKSIRSTCKLRRPGETTVVTAICAESGVGVGLPFAPFQRIAPPNIPTVIIRSIERYKKCTCSRVGSNNKQQQENRVQCYEAYGTGPLCTYVRGWWRRRLFGSAFTVHGSLELRLHRKKNFCPYTYMIRAILYFQQIHTAPIRSTIPTRGILVTI